MNPYTGRCLKYYGRKAREIMRDPYQIQQRRTQRKPRAFAAAFGAGATSDTKPIFWDAPQAVPVAAPTYNVAPCPPGTQRNPDTGRCIRIGGRTFKRVIGLPKPLPPPPTRQELRRTASEPTPRLPVGSATVAPLADRATILGWAAGNCAQQRDALTGIPFTNTDAAALQQLMRLHDGTCVLAPPLHTKVAAQHREGKPATLPADPDSDMTLDDFKALRAAMRRTNPAYKLPARKRQPPPPTWRLYVASDARSGPDYVSVLYVDGRQVPEGSPVIPPAAVRIDLGFLPLRTAADAMCSGKMLVELTQRVAGANRLLEPVAGGWKPAVPGFPFTKQYWTRDPTGERVSRLCKLLAFALANPM